MKLKKKIGLYLDIILGLYKSIYVCFRYLPFSQAVKLPILISWHCSIIELGGKIEILAEDIKPGMILFGIGSIGFIDKKYKRSVLELGENSHIVFERNARFGNGMKISSNGTLMIGDNVTVTGDSLIFCRKSIKIGKESLISWGVEIMDSDMHKIYNNGYRVNEDKAIDIGNHVWISSGCKILKGTKLANNMVVAANSLITKEVLTENMVVGMNGKCIKENIVWER